MPALSSARLLKYALPLVKVHGFTRETLARSVLHLPPTETRTNTHVEPLSDTAVSALFGEGDEARRTLINAWLQDGLRHMGTFQGVERPTIILEDELDTAAQIQIGASQQATSATKASIKDVLYARLKYNEPALSYLPEAFAILISPSLGYPPVDLQPALKHAAQVADTACFVTGDKSLQLEWYARRACLAAVYAAAELHQLTSPASAYSFLNSLLHSSSNFRSAIDEVAPVSYRIDSKDRFPSLRALKRQFPQVQIDQKGIASYKSQRCISLFPLKCRRDNRQSKLNQKVVVLHPRRAAGHCKHLSVKSPTAVNP